MIQGAASRFLKALAHAAARDGSYPAFLFLDSFGEPVAAGHRGPTPPQMKFTIGASGIPEPIVLPKDLAYLASRIEVYGNPVGFLVTLYPRDLEDKARALSEVAQLFVTFAAEKNFELDDLSAALNRFFEEKAFLFEITKELGDSTDLQDFCVRLAKRVASILESPRALVLLASEDRSEYRVAGAFGLENWAGRQFPVEQGVCGAAIGSGKVQLFEDPSSFPATLSPLEGEARRGLLAAPIVSGTSGGGLGALCVMDGGRSGSFTSEEAALLRFIAEYVASLVSGLSLVELKKEVQIAQRIIEGLLPDKAPSVPGFELAGKLSPARVVGGDYYDFLPMRNGRTGVVIADVSGHTLSATLLMTVARAAFRWAAADSHQASPAEMLRTVSRRLFEDLSSAEFFMSMFLLVLGSDRRVGFGNAGHPPALLYRTREGRFEELDAEGMAAGILREVDFEEKTVTLGEGDLLILYTDGITEALRADAQEMFGVERLKDAVRKAASFPADEVVEAVFQAVYGFAGGNVSDDLTVVVLKGLAMPALLISKGTQDEGARSR